MDDNQENNPPDPPNKKPRLSLSLKGKGKGKGRFASPLPLEEMSSVCEGYTPANTSKNTDWAVRVFNEWRKARPTEEEGECPPDLLECPCAEKLNFWLARFVVECRRVDGKPYPASTLYQILSGLLRYSRSKSVDCINFLDKKDARFASFRGACDTLSRELRKEGIGAEVKHAAIFTPEEEEQLWSTGTIGTHCPKALVRAVYFVLGKNLCLRGGKEQRDLNPSMLRREHNPDRYVYVENGSKNHPGKFGRNEPDNKIVTIFSNEKAGQRCPVYVIDLYFSKIPCLPSELECMYLKPLSKTPLDETKPWFCLVPVGKNLLSKYVELMCEDAGLEKRSNHSLRATGASALFTAGVPEKIIKGITGHRSSKALEVYERPTQSQLQAVSSVMSQPGCCFSEELHSRSEVYEHKKEMTTSGAGLLGSMFSGLNECSIQIAPQSMVVNIMQSPQSQSTGK